MNIKVATFTVSEKSINTVFSPLFCFRSMGTSKIHCKSSFKIGKTLASRSP